MHLPNTTSEQRSRFYDDIEMLLSPGFLTHPVVVAGERLQIRSLSSGDLFMLRARTEGVTSRDWRVWAVASSIWMINGRVVLGHDEAIPFLMGYVNEMPNTMLGILFSTLLGLWARVGDAVEDIEAFNYEQVSRFKWKSINKRLLDSGVPGADKLGLNTVQRIWMAFNEMEDSRRADDTAWEGFKLVASSNSPKAVTKIDERDSQRRQNELNMRQERMNQFFYGKVGLYKPDPAKGPQRASASHRLANKSVEDLEEEMRRWVTNDADQHDATVEAYKADIRATREAEKAQMAARRMALEMERARLDTEAIEAGSKPKPLLALTGEQLQQMLQGRGSFGRSGTTFIPKAPSADRLYNKYVAEGSVSPGQLKMAGDKVLDPQADPATDTRTLSELIKSRNPAFGAGE